MALTYHLTWASVSLSGGWEMGWVKAKVPSILDVLGPGSSQALVPLALPSPSTDHIPCWLRKG